MKKAFYWLLDRFFEKANFGDRCYFWEDIVVGQNVALYLSKRLAQETGKNFKDTLVSLCRKYRFPIWAYLFYATPEKWFTDLIEPVTKKCSSFYLMRNQVNGVSTWIIHKECGKQVPVSREPKTFTQILTVAQLF